jgi:hypothetical protein
MRRADLLKLYIYGYLNRVRSSRRLEAECHRNIEVIWLLRTLKPDFKTIADFRSDIDPPSAPCSASSRCCAGNSIFSGASCWRWMARASRRSTTRARRERCRGSRDRRLAHQKPRGEDRGAAREARAIRGAADGTGAERRVSLTDPDSRAMAAHTQGRRPLQYPGRRRREEQMIVDQVVTNQVVDMGPVEANRRIGPRHPWLRRSMSSPIAATSRSRTSRPARMRG